MEDDNKILFRLEDFKEEITNISKSDNGNFIVSDIKIINFDKVKKEYCKIRKNISEMPNSNDGLYFFNEKNVFIEFKNEYKNRIDIYELGRKNYASICILSDILNISIRKIREHTKYILVYSSEKNSRIELSKSFQKKSGKKEENLEDLRKNCFRQKKFLNFLYCDVEAINDKEFKEKYLGKEII